MSDHLDYIRIRGLIDNDLEAFQGLGGESSSTAVEGGAGATTPFAWGDMPIEVVEMLTNYTKDLQAWLQQAEAYTPNSGSRGELLAAVPSLPSMIGAAGAVVATGGAALPAVATVMITQAVTNLVGSAVQNYADEIDDNSPRNLFKRAFLYDEDGAELSILKKALLYLQDSKQESVLKDKLEALGYNDEVLDFGPFRVWLKGKLIEYH